MYVEKNLVVGPFQCNCRLIVCSETGESVLIDPGDEDRRILEALAGVKLPSGRPVQVRYILHTHGHLDHIGAARAVKTSIGRALQGAQGDVPRKSPEIALHRDDEPLYLALKAQGAFFGIPYDDPLPIDHYLEDGEDLQVGGLRFSVLHTPGHSPGSVCLRLHEDAARQVPETLFSGDTLFQGSVGRTDLWGSDGDQMFRSIRGRILGLDDDTRVCPGHGPETRIGVERRSNPFLK